LIDFRATIDFSDFSDFEKSPTFDFGDFRLSGNFRLFRLSSDSPSMGGSLFFVAIAAVILPEHPPPARVPRCRRDHGGATRSHNIAQNGQKSRCIAF
jgi:hypothetical protein